MKRTWAFLLSFFFSPKNDLKKVKKQLDVLKIEISTIKNMEHSAAIHSIVKLFQVISPIQDAGGVTKLISVLKKKNYGQLDQKIEALEILQLHFNTAGRDQYGLNRTKVGEEVTFNNVFLGNVDGIWTKTAAYWLEHREARIDAQARTFADSHVVEILKQLALI